MDAVSRIENAFHTLAIEQVIMPLVLQLDIRENNGEVCIKTAYLPGLENFAIKISSGFFDNPKIGLPSGSGMMNLFNSKTGIRESVLLDKGYLTDIRTVAAVSAKWLSNKNSAHATIIGAGIQAEYNGKHFALCVISSVVLASDTRKHRLLTHLNSPG